MSSTKVRGRGNVHTRRNLAEFDATDPYTPRFAPEETAVCTECHALYERRHWFFDPVTSPAHLRQGDTPSESSPALPGTFRCESVKNRFFKEEREVCQSLGDYSQVNCRRNKEFAYRLSYSCERT